MGCVCMSADVLPGGLGAAALDEVAANCYYVSLGWWSYELCPGHHLGQFHALEQSMAIDSILSLGVYDAEQVWSPALFVNRTGCASCSGSTSSSAGPCKSAPGQGIPSLLFSMQSVRDSACRQSARSDTLYDWKSCGPCDVCQSLTVLPAMNTMENSVGD